MVRGTGRAHARTHARTHALPMAACPGGGGGVGGVPSPPPPPPPRCWDPSHPGSGVDGCPSLAPPSPSPPVGQVVLAHEHLGLLAQPRGARLLPLDGLGGHGGNGEALRECARGAQGGWRVRRILATGERRRGTRPRVRRRPSLRPAAAIARPPTLQCPHAGDRGGWGAPHRARAAHHRTSIAATADTLSVADPGLPALV